MRKTKIICTLGPASETEEVIRELILSGMDVARINFSHGEHSEHKKKVEIIKKLRKELGTHTALLLDTKGPEVRLKKFRDGSATLKTGDSFYLYLNDREGDEKGVSITYTGLWRDVTVGSRILVDDGLIELRVDNVKETEIKTTVLNGGKLSDKKGINVPGVKLSMPFLSEKDKDDLAFGAREGFDFIAASFTQSAEDIRMMREELEKHGCSDIRIIAKIENTAGVENVDEILNEADGIMVARGDLGAEVPMENIPILQKQLISKCYNAGKQVITATQMLESMTHNPRPTRAEITDVANAIYDGTSATMLSGETAMGKYPVESVKRMAKIAMRTESDIDYKKRFFDNRFGGFTNVTDAISHATCTTAHDLGAKTIITVTTSGYTARLLSRFRPQTDIIACSPSERACRHMNMSWGVIPLLVDKVAESSEELLEMAVDEAYKNGHVEYGDLVVITAGLPLGVSGTTNMLKVQMVGDVLLAGNGIVDKSVCGKLCVCGTDAEALTKFENGDIIVIPSASDRIIGILRHASAIICERGGDDSYAAIVGKTLNIPVIVGAENATKILKTGTTVTVDGKLGMVYCNEKCVLS
ncbi:MAG: pyruvate kinase [Clostridia bacterium]|nr:pyruvate kinase [Clostridia bacterium]